MGKKEKEKSKKYDELRAIVREEMENVLRNVFGNLQFSFNTQIEEATTAEESTEQHTQEEQSVRESEAPVQEEKS
ncbi:hypothetical protein RGU12_05385 [Fredinandcohnia sp. QZ13]|uniref:hypothetical protein n=1 Tax=Fredinandcohnia sp. QZ13 TaxID=3073144 RepID=UPI0028531564|nr:hypothetical protein [Fredinandcohnia sp. QZ13]MDR4886985.1 hypothetical protein [Fredinandcohnia sp. QZ13]